jgi:Ca-activated chloride channel family protein
MQPSDDIEKRLQGTPVPRLKDGLHRETLKQALLAELRKENVMTEKTSPANGDRTPMTQSASRRRTYLPLWIAAPVVAAVVVFAISRTPWFDSLEPIAKEKWAMSDVRPMSAESMDVRRGDLRNSEGGEPLLPDSDDASIPGLAKRNESVGNADGKTSDFANGINKSFQGLGGGLAGGGALGGGLAGALGGVGGGRGFESRATERWSGVVPRSESGANPTTGSNSPRVIRFKDGAEVTNNLQPPADHDHPDTNTGDNYAHKVDNPFHKPAQTPLSTFSIDVDTASYTNARRFLMDERRLPPKDAVRIEEMVNYFTYDDPRPTDGKPVAIKTEVGPCPWHVGHQLVRIGLKAKSVSAEDSPPRNLVFLLDTSGSMAPADRLPLLKQGLQMLVGTLRPEDRVAIVAYAGSAGLVLPSTPGTQKGDILAALGRLHSGGSTNGGQGITLAYNIAQENFLPKGVNRVILGTDGDFNVGVTSDGELVRLIEEKRKTGVFLSILGFGHGNLKDATMEKLAHHGNGHYAYIDNAEEAHRIFVEQGASLQVVASDVKVQVEFNPARVAAYRLVGYENRLMKDQDFNDDKKDAGDMGSGHSVTALYEIIPAGAPVDAAEVPDVDPLRYQKVAKLTPDAKSNELMIVKVRYKDPGAEKSKLISQPVVGAKPALKETSADFRFAAAVAEFALILRDSPHKGTATFENAVAQAQDSLGLDAHGHRAAFVRMVQAAEKLKKQ